MHGTSDMRIEEAPGGALQPRERRLRAAAWAVAMMALLGIALLLTGMGPTGTITTALAAALGAGVAVAAFAGGGRLSGSDDDAVMAHVAVHSPEGRVVTDADGVVRFANEAYLALAGARGGPPPRLESLMGDDDIALRQLRELQRAALAGGYQEDDIPVRTVEGVRRWVRVRAETMDAAATRVVWYLADVTAEHDLQEALLEEQLKLADFLDTAPVGFLSADSKGNLLLVNGTLAAWLGYARAEMIDGVTLDHLVAGDASRLYPTAHDLGRPPQTLELKLNRRDGHTIPVEVTQTVASEPSGTDLRTRTVLRDLSREREWKAALKLARKRFRRYFDSAPIAVLTLDREGRILEANPAFRALVTGGEEVVGVSFESLITAEDRDEARQRLDEIWTGAPARDVLEVRVGSILGDRHMQLFAGRLEEVVGDVPGLLMHMIDTTDQRNLELRFAQSQKMQAIGQLAGGVAHDFNNLLTAIIGHCDLLLLRARPGDETFPDIMQVKQNANRAANLVRQLLAFSRQQTLRPKILSLTDVLAELAHLLRRLIGANIELQIRHDRDLGPVKVDQNQLEQVIINLAVNARDAMPDGGALSISTRNVSYEESRRLGHELMPAGEYVLVEVKDTGKGIPKSDLGKIFEPFFTTKRPGSGTGSGTGLGLSTVYGIIKQTGGFIFPDSKVGKGTTFRIYLPRHKPREDQPENAAVEADEPEGRKDLTGKGTILLVEDEDAVRVFAARALKNKGYTVLEAESGEAALALLQAQRQEIDLLISDVVMPHMDGPTLINRVRQDRPDLKVIFISGYAEDAFRKNLAPGSDFELLPKPFSLKQLAGKVKEVIGERG